MYQYTKCSFRGSSRLLLLAAVVVPEISRVLTVSDIIQTSVMLSWSIGNTQHVDHIQVDQRGVDAESTSANRRFNASSRSSHNVTRLSPGTTYEFYVQIHSYGNTAKTQTTTIATGTTLYTVHSFIIVELYLFSIVYGLSIECVFHCICMNFRERF